MLLLTLVSLFLAGFWKNYSPDFPKIW